MENLELRSHNLWGYAKWERNGFLFSPSMQLLLCNFDNLNCQYSHILKEEIMDPRHKILHSLLSDTRALLPPVSAPARTCLYFVLCPLQRGMSPHSPFSVETSMIRIIIVASQRYYFCYEKRMLTKRTLLMKVFFNSIKGTCYEWPELNHQWGLSDNCVTDYKENKIYWMLFFIQYNENIR